MKLYNLTLPRGLFVFRMPSTKASLNPLKVFKQLHESIHWLEILVCLIEHLLKPLKAPFPKGLGSILTFSMIENFLWPFIRNRINITFGSRDRCKASWWMSIAFATLPPRMPLLLMKLAGDHGRV